MNFMKFNIHISFGYYIRSVEFHVPDLRFNLNTIRNIFKFHENLKFSSFFMISMSVILEEEILHFKFLGSYFKIL